MNTSLVDSSIIFKINKIIVAFRMFAVLALSKYSFSKRRTTLYKCTLYVSTIVASVLRNLVRMIRLWFSKVKDRIVKDTKLIHVDIVTLWKGRVERVLKAGLNFCLGQGLTCSIQKRLMKVESIYESDGLVWIFK